MPKSKASSVVQVGPRSLVDAGAMGELIGFTSKWVSAMAREGRIPWVGIRNGCKIYRRYDPVEVMAALAHGVEASDEDDAPITAREVAAAPPVRKRRSTAAPETRRTAAPAARDRAAETVPSP